MQIAGRRVTLMGLGHFGGGVAAARWLAAGGAKVTITDTAMASTLAVSLAALSDVEITAYHLGGHQEDDFRQADLVVVNPAVRPDDPYVKLAVSCGVATTSEIELFLDACPGPIVAVTGSNGKSTTAAMTAAIFRAAGRPVWLGGNIGASLLEDLGTIRPQDVIVLELSSFQLRHLSTGESRNVAFSRTPHAPREVALTPSVRSTTADDLRSLSPQARPVAVAVVTNCTPNHLDWHGSWADYVAAKQQILRRQTPEGLAVLNASDAEVGTWAGMVRGRLVPLAADGRIPPLAVPGEHNRINARLAAAAAMALGCSWEAVRDGLAGYQPLSQRLESLGVVAGRRVYNDSSATTPESTIAALESVEGRVWLLAGGAGKGSDFRPLVRQITRRAAGAALFGKVRELLCEGLAEEDPHFPCAAVETMAEALAWCWDRSRPGDAILLSPACSSHDQFQNFRQRGEQFAQRVQRYA
jgi:UDP-N-acetylmuramoylalanine--D-glutamate ligase